MELKPWEELVGTLERVMDSEEMTILFFKVVTPVSVPSGRVDVEALKEYIGHRIGILNTPDGVRIRRV